ncbi:hypothetical protein HZH66_004290 [Vespula vulgaris]|uniref:Uncharacterized protein n=1 Tax=Vespula vulgaris TaxID=7454 RepID=A0A834KCB0_VESVU|nr:hypothetical protein HZH66_004290 [Vespula vulgaris]
MRKRVENIEENMPDTYTPNVSVDRGESSSSVTATSVAWKDGDWPSAKSVNQERLISVSPGDHEVPFLRLTAGGKALLRTIFTISGPPASSCPRLLARRHCERIDFLWSQCGSSNDDDDNDDDNNDEDQDAVAVAAMVAAAISRRRALTYGHEFTSFVRLSTLFYIFSCKRTEHS